MVLLSKRKRSRHYPPGEPQLAGERLVVWLRVFIAVVGMVIILIYIGHSAEHVRNSLLISGASVLIWGLLDACVFAILSRGYYRPWLSYASTATDILLVTAVQIAMTVAMPLNIINGLVSFFYFIVIALAALRKSRNLVVFTGISAAVIHLIVSAVIFSLYLPSGYVFTEVAGYPLDVTVFDEVVRAVLFAAVAWVFGYVTEQLTRSERHYQDLFEHVPDGIIIVSAGGKIRAVNRRFANMVGIPPDSIVGRPMDAFLSREYVEALIERASNESNDSAAWLVRRDGTKMPVRTVSMPIDYRGEECVEMSVRDVTDQVELERQLVQSQKMETLGRLAGGLAHDINNILGGILGAASLMERTISRFADDSIREKLDLQLSLIRDCGGRASDVVNRLLSFSRQAAVESSPVDLCAIITEVATICTNTFGKGIAIHVEVPDHAAVTLGDGTSLSQSLLNLCINARDAMPSGGRLGVRLHEVAIDEQVIGRHPSAKTGVRYWCIEVEDSGVGMDQAMLDRIFEPFFTTKPMGEGTGLGLSIVYKIIEEHGGFVDVQSRVNAGSVFRIYLLISERRLIEPVTPEQELPQGRGTILVVDDEEAILVSASGLLMELGYDVRTASGGEQALEMIGTGRNEVELLVLDIIMPEMDGLEVVRRLRERNRDIKVIAMSGFWEIDREGELEQLEISGILKKPFTSAELARAVAEILSPSQAEETRTSAQK